LINGFRPLISAGSVRAGRRTADIRDRGGSGWLGTGYLTTAVAVGTSRAVCGLHGDPSGGRPGLIDETAVAIRDHIARSGDSDGASVNLHRVSPAVYLITGISAAGKSTVAQALAERLPRSVHVRGDLFRRMIVNGRAEPAPDSGKAALTQLRLRYRLAANVADAYVEAGFTAVVQDVVLGPELGRVPALFRSRPLFVIVLAPRPDVVAARERGRSKSGYREWTVDQLDRGLRHETPRIGLWLDTSELTVAETVDELLRRAQPEAQVA